jgi:hypothetical protein
MAELIQILTVERDSEDGLTVTFSDGTVAGYVAEELLELRPFREPTESNREDWPLSRRGSHPQAGSGLALLPVALRT